LTAVADPLLAPADLVADDRAVFLDRNGFGGHGGEVAARARFGRAVADEQRLVGDLAHPEMFLLRRAADGDWV